MSIIGAYRLYSNLDTGFKHSWRQGTHVLRICILENAHQLKIIINANLHPSTIRSYFVYSFKVLIKWIDIE
jgi:hypothetical protein